jgi:hypothetical protein
LLEELDTRLFLEPGHREEAAHSVLKDDLIAMMVF